MQRISERLRLPDLNNDRVSLFVLLGSALAMLFVLAAVYGRGISHSAVFVNDSFVFFDGIDAIAGGLLPNKDIISPVGPLAYLLPYWGYEILGKYPGAVELASVILAAPVLIASALLMWRHTMPLMAIFLMGIIAGVIVVPLVPGLDPSLFSHAMHYNRWGWGLLCAVMLLGLPGSSGKGWIILASISGGLFLAALFLIKITFFLVGGAYLALLIVFMPDARRWAGLGALVVCGLVLAVLTLIHPDVVFGYLGGIWQALQASDAKRGSYLFIAYENRISVSFLIVAVYIAAFGMKVSWRNLMLVAFVLFSGLALIDQNYQWKFLVTLPVAFGILAAGQQKTTEDSGIPSSTILLCCVLAYLPYLADWARVTLTHVQKPPSIATAFQNEELNGMYVYDRGEVQSGQLNLGAAPIDVAAVLRGELPSLTCSQQEYAQSLDEAAELLKSVGADKSEVLTLDFTNAVPVMVDGPRDRWQYSWFHFGRNVSADSLPDGAEMFEGYDYVLVPIATLTHKDTDKLISRYGNYLAKSSTEVAQSDYWILLKMEN